MVFNVLFLLSEVNPRAGLHCACSQRGPTRNRRRLMRKTMQRSRNLAVVLLLGCATAAFADSVSMTLTGVNAGYVMGGVYTSPYNVTANGTPMLLICDDFTFDIPSIPWQWTAT